MNCCIPRAKLCASIFILILISQIAAMCLSCIVISSIEQQMRVNSANSDVTMRRHGTRDRNGRLHDRNEPHIMRFSEKLESQTTVVEEYRMTKPRPKLEKLKPLHPMITRPKRSVDKVHNSYSHRMEDVNGYKPFAKPKSTIRINSIQKERMLDASAMRTSRWGNHHQHSSSGSSDNNIWF